MPCAAARPVLRPIVLLLAAVIAASIGLKLATGPIKRNPDLGDTRRQLERLAQAGGYAIGSDSAVIAAPNLVASHDRCRRRLFVLDPFAAFAARVRSIRQPGETLVFHRGTATHAEAPRLWPGIANYAQAYLLAMGIDWPATPVIGELSSGDCRAAPRIDFGRLRSRLIRD